MHRIFLFGIALTALVWPRWVQAATPLETPIPALSDASMKHDQWVHKAILEAYDAVGHHNPKWDEAARKALALSADMWGPPRFRGDGNFAQYTIAKGAIDAGCDDPMVLFAYARTFSSFGRDPEQCFALHQRAADALSRSKYSRHYAALAHLRTAQIQVELLVAKARSDNKPIDPEGWKEVTRRVSIAMGLTALMAKEKDLPLAQWVEIGVAMAGVFSDGVASTQTAVEFAFPFYEKNAPKVAALTIKGELYTTWAWDARGRGFANTVKDEGWKLMQERLAVAQKALEEAWQLDPTNSSAATYMIDVELGQGQGRDRMELWFKRAMQADPDNYEACKAKLNYLEPKWYGTPKDMIEFGRECLKTGRFQTFVPNTLCQAHYSLSHYTQGGYNRASDPAYYQTPGVWNDLRDVYDGYLRGDKGASLELTQNGYAQLACKCQAWDDAAKMFTTIGDHFDPRVWTKEQCEAARATALANAKK